MMRALAREVSLSNLFCAYVLRRNMQYQQDLVDQRCNFGKKRLARILLLFAHFDGQTAEDAVIPNINHETPAEMVGTTRSRVCFFTKRFRRSAYIDYRLYTQLIRIRRSLIAFLAGPKRVASHRPFVGSAYRTEQAGDRKDDHEDDYKKWTTDDVQPTLSFLKIEGRPDQLVLDARKPKEGQKALLQAH